MANASAGFYSAPPLYNRQESAQALAEKLGVCRPTLYNWKNQLLGPEAPARHCQVV
ncbi:helix-turn-helix domain-containing protein [Brucella anthropi]|nr:helix-turn-helix domain-containing protein [Brucella anthropi]